MDSRPRGPGRVELTQLDRGELERVELDGRYRLDGLLGKGGMARVYRGSLLALDRPVAIKILDESRSDRHASLGRFMAEARIAASVRHRNIVDVSDFGTTQEGLVYLVMELLDGEDLRQIVRREGPLPWARVRGLMLQLCAGLAAVHERGIVHRDLKPSNCFIVDGPEGEQLKLLDFGIALALDDSQSAAGSAAAWTRDDNVVGTPEYMSPEQACADEVDARSDIYSLGIILAELLTGKVPFAGKTATAVMAAQTGEAPPSLRELAEADAVDPAIEALYRKCLRKCPEGRFADVYELAEAIFAIPPERELIPRARPLRLVRSPALGLAAAIAFAVLGASFGMCTDNQAVAGEPNVCEPRR